MSLPEDLKPATKKKYGEKGSRGAWAHLDEETRERYKAIEARVRDKVEKGLL